MILNSTKTKIYLLTGAKVSVLTLTFGYIIYKVSNNDTLVFGEIMSSIISKGIISTYSILVFLLFTVANWYFEIKKWQTLVSSFEKIDFKMAMKQSLASLTVSLATPNRIGEYGAKTLFYESQNRKKVLLLNFYSGAIQMFVTSTFGVIGFCYFLQKFNLRISYINLWLLALMAILIFGIGYFLKEKELLVKGFTIGKTISFLKQLPFRVKLKTVIFSTIRYLIFSSLFLGLLLFFGANIAISEAYFLIFCMYFLVSILPTLFILDVIIRGGVAVWLFSFAGIPELTVLSTVLAMWILNSVLPSVLGSFYVVSYQPITR